MAASPGVPSVNTPPAPPFVAVITPPIPPSSMGVCRLCAQESTDLIDIFSETGKRKDLPEKLKLVLPILVQESDDLSKAVCQQCIEGVETVRAFFQKCINANQELIIALRKTKPSPLDLNTHLNQYVRSFNPPTVPQIKIEPSSYLDVDLGPIEEKLTNGYYDEEWIVQEDDDMEEEEEEESESEGDSDSEADFFKVPKVPKKKATKSKVVKNEFQKSNGVGSNRGRKRFVPLALKTCSFCSQEFADHAGNLSHWKEAHPDDEVLYKCLEIERHTGQLCSFTSKESEEIFKHRSKHKIRNNDSTASNGLHPVDIKPEVNIDCKICGKYFTTSFLIYRHMSTHEDRKDFKCGVCGIENKSPEDLKSHLKVHTPNDAKYAHCCELCGKRFTQRANLDAHLRVHSGIKPYNCDFCHKSFSQKGNMEEHRRVHTGERPFVCEQCGASFMRRSEMALHNRIVHTGERPYQCAYCPKNFQRRDLMRKHERIHTDTRPYQCQFCHKAFTQRDKMVVHTRLHTGERPYVCEVCGKGFCESGNLKKHMRVHGKEPPQIMHQNNKGKPAPNHLSNFDSKPSANQLLLQQQQFQQQQINNSEAENSNSSSSNLVTNNNPREAESVSPSPIQASTTSNAQSLHLKLRQAAASAAVVENGNPAPAAHQYPFAAVAAALHNQIGQQQQHPIPQASHQYQNQPQTTQQALQQPQPHRNTATPLSMHSDNVDNQSEAGSERSEVQSPFVTSAPTSQNPHPAHQAAASSSSNHSLPYHMHHSLIQHLTDMTNMRDLYGAAGHQSLGNAINHHGSNH